MQTPVTVVMLLHDTATRSRPAGLQGSHGVQLAGDPPHLGLRRPPEGGAYPPPACAGLSALSPVGASAPGRESRTLDAQAGQQAPLRHCPQPYRGRVCRSRENAHLLYGGGRLRQPGRPAAAFSCGRELTPHVQAHFGPALRPEISGGRHQDGAELASRLRRRKDRRPAKGPVRPCAGSRAAHRQLCAIRHWFFEKQRQSGQ